MRVYEIQRFGIADLALAERPDPRAAGEHGIVVRVKAASLNYRDLVTVKGVANPKQRLPLVPLSDGAGEVVAVGDRVKRVKVGDRVAGIFFQAWLAGERNERNARSALGGHLDGMLAEYVTLDENGVVHIPAHLSYEEAATLPCAAVTAWNALVRVGKIVAGEIVLVLGTGGVSIFALQFARMAGARVIVTSSSDEKLGKALSLGANDGINYRTTPEWDARVRELTDGRGADHVIEVGGGGTLPRSLNAVRMGGFVALIGILTGGKTEINPMPILTKNIHLDGIYVGSREMFEEMNRAIALHELRPAIDRVFDFTEAREALEYMESAAHFGKIVIRVS